MHQDIGHGRFYLGDCFEHFQKIEPGSVDMVLCDLPYGVTANEWDKELWTFKLWREYWRVLKPDGVAVLTAQTPFDKMLGYTEIDNLRYEWIWKKSNMTNAFNARKMPMRGHENILVFYRELPTYNPQGLYELATARLNKRRTQSANYGKARTVRPTNQYLSGYPNTVLEFDREVGAWHPTQKPVALWEYLIRTYTNEGETVLDNTAGSGTTAIAAERTGRRWICMELSKEYAERAVERIQDELMAMEGTS